MASSIFTTPPDTAYENLGVKAPGQRWFAFDVSMPEARQGKAKKFVMAVWNFHTIADSEKFEAWAIKRDVDTGAYWYRVARVREGQAPNNRKSLWDALHIAHDQGIPMSAILKDRKSRSCAPEFMFPISSVQVTTDGSALWLKLEVQGEVGTDVETLHIPEMVDARRGPGDTSKRSAKLTEAQYSAACEWAARVEFDRAKRSDAIAVLEQEHAINPNSASVLINNYRCLVHGVTIKAPMSADAMQWFVDSVIAHLGSSAVPNVIKTLDGYVEYAASQWQNTSEGMVNILADLRAMQERDDVLESVAVDLAPLESHDADDAPSEILRELWVRGSQHAAFRRELQRRWSNTCSVHGAACNGQLRASHIVAWRLDEKLRGDVNNGLLLSVPLDSLFDRGLITFSDDGLMMRSHLLEPPTAQHFGLREDLRIAWDFLPAADRAAMKCNLARHREFHRQLGPFI
jgi:hypothetical protein